MITRLLLLFAAVYFFSCTTRQEQEKKQSPDIMEVELQNPIITGYFADPSIVQYEDKFHVTDESGSLLRISGKKE